MRDVTDSAMISIPAGAFLMGSDTGFNEEKPVHKVGVSAFEIDAFPVTNSQCLLGECIRIRSLEGQTASDRGRVGICCAGRPPSAGQSLGFPSRCGSFLVIGRK